MIRLKAILISWFGTWGPTKTSQETYSCLGLIYFSILFCLKCSLLILTFKLTFYPPLFLFILNLTVRNEANKHGFTKYTG